MKFIRKRLLFELVLAVCFFAITIFAIFLAQGNVITPDGIIKETGVVEISSVPEDVNAFIDDKPVQISGNRIINLLTGKMTLRLEKEGYTSWTKLLEVSNEKITYAYAQLFPKELKREQLLTQNIHKLVYSEDKSRIIFTVLESEVKDEIGIWKYEFNQTIPIIQNNRPVRMLTLSEDLQNTLKTFDYSLTITRDNAYVLLDVPDVKLLRLINIGNSNDVVNLVSLIGFYPELVKVVGDSNTIIVKEKNLIYEQKLDSGEKNIIYIDQNNPPIFSISDQGLLFYDNFTEKINYFTNGTSSPIQLTNAIKNTELNAIDLSSLKNLFLPSNNQNVYILQTTEKIYYIEKETNYITTLPDSLSINKVSPDGQSFIYTNKDQTLSFVYDKVLKTAKSFVINKTNVVGEINYTSTNKQLLQINPVKNRSELEVLDIDGGNRLELIKEIDLLNSSTAFLNAQSTNLYLVINSSGTNKAPNYNLYVVELE